jgi:flagellar L-ring protein precursor FlgH
MRVRTGLAVGLWILAVPVASWGQTAAPPETTATAAAAPVAPARASWVSDRLPLRVGDVLTVVVDEQTNAREQVSQTASGQRSQDASLQARLNGDDAVKPTRITSGLNGSSRDVGEARRLGDLTATMSVRVTEVGEGGIARIQGERSVTVDGRQQQIKLSGFVRSEDVTASNIVYSSRIADAVIAYSGKKIGPRTSFIGRLLGMLWP